MPIIYCADQLQLRGMKQKLLRQVIIYLKLKEKIR